METYTLITGASGGIGYELAKVFAEKKHNLVLVARNIDKLSSLKDSLEKQYKVKAEIIEKDLIPEKAAVELYEEVEKRKLIIEILVNNAGFGDYAGFLDSDWEKQRNMVDLNITALMHMTYIFGNDMKKRGYGRILNLSSVAAFSAGPYMPIYYATKGFVLSFSEAVAEELKGTGVAVTALCPGPTLTGFESAAEMKNSKMFTAFGAARAKDVADCGYQALMKGKAVQYHGLPTRLMNIGSRLFPRQTARKFAKSINGVPEK